MLILDLEVSQLGETNIPDRVSKLLGRTDQMKDELDKTKKPYIVWFSSNREKSSEISF